MRPKLAGAAVVVERRKGTAWVTVGDTTSNASGVFVLELDAVVPRGAYRARVAPVSGFLEGTSPVVQVTE